MACTHKPPCPSRFDAEGEFTTDRDAARIIRDVPEEGYEIRCGGPDHGPWMVWYEEDDYSPRNAPRSRAEAIAMAAA